ncbi:MAG: hypothetical protein WBV61_11030 [Rhodanobacteraceae bacterium]
MERRWTRLMAPALRVEENRAFLTHLEKQWTTAFALAGEQECDDTLHGYPTRHCIARTWRIAGD